MEPLPHLLLLLRVFCCLCQGFIAQAQVQRCCWPAAGAAVAILGCWDAMQAAPQVARPEQRYKCLCSLGGGCCQRALAGAARPTAAAGGVGSDTACKCQSDVAAPRSQRERQLGWRSEVDAGCCLPGQRRSSKAPGELGSGAHCHGCGALGSLVRRLALLLPALCRALQPLLQPLVFFFAAQGRQPPVLCGCRLLRLRLAVCHQVALFRPSRIPHWLCLAARHCWTAATGTQA